MKKYLSLFLLLVTVVFAQGQSSGLGPVYDPDPAKLQNTDSLRRLLNQADADTTKVDLLILLAHAYLLTNKDSALWYTQQATDLAQRINYLRGQFGARTRMVLLFRDAGNYSEAVKLLLTNLEIAEQYKDTLRMYYMNQFLSQLFNQMNDFARQLQYARKVQQLVHSGYFKTPKQVMYYSLRGYANQMALAFEGLNQLDSALSYWQRSYKLASSLEDNQGIAGAANGIASTLIKKGRYNEAFSHYRMAIGYAEKSGREYSEISGRAGIIAGAQLGLANLFARNMQLDSAQYYGRMALTTYQRLKLPAQELKAALFLNELYAKKNRADSAYKYLSMATVLKDSLFNQEKFRQVQNLQFNEALRQQQLEQEKKEAQQRYATRVKLYSLIAGLAVVILIASLLYRNNQQKQKANALLLQQKQEIEKQNARIQVEVALERVRASALAMQDSKDVGNAVGILFTELEQLGIAMLRCGIAIVEEAQTTVELWTAVSTAEGRIGQVQGRVNVMFHPVTEGIFNAWKAGQQFYTYELKGKELVDYYRALSGSRDYSIPIKYTEKDQQVVSAFYFREGCLFIYTLEPLTQEACQILKKFTAVFSLTYRRYLDLKKAEEQTRKAIQEASLDRVRAEIASMRSA
ncbi:MAG: hypothetical protein ICV79_26200, partial [Flavisolibacter sp.]|nr:hypothetical protein [Flavisolibacter sp.]